MHDDFRKLYDENFSRVFAYFYAFTGSVVSAKALASLTFQRAGEERRGGRVPLLNRLSLFILARAVREEHPEPPVTGHGGTENLTAEEEAVVLRYEPDISRFISRLDPLSRELISLRFDAGLDYAEIAEVLNLETDDVAPRMLEAIQKLTALIAQT